jgi:septum formation protein
MTGLCLYRPDKKIQVVQVETTQVTFVNAADEMLQAYIATGEPMDKAGAYGIQGLGSILVLEIKGSCSNVIGLPLSSLISLLLQHKIIAPTPTYGLFP